MASSKKRPAPESNATKPVPDDQRRFILMDALSKLATALSPSKKTKSAQVKQQPQHYVVISDGSKTSATKKRHIVMGDVYKKVTMSKHYIPVGDASETVTMSKHYIPVGDASRTSKHYIVMSSGSKTGARSKSKTPKTLPSGKPPKYLEVDASKRQLAGSTKRSSESIIRPGRGPAKLGAKGEPIRQDRRDQLFAGSRKLDKPLRLQDVGKKQITEKGYQRDRGDSRMTTKAEESAHDGVNGSRDRHRKCCSVALFIVAATIAALIILAGVVVGVYFAVTTLLYPIATTTFSPPEESTSYAGGIPASSPLATSRTSPAATSMTSPTTTSTTSPTATSTTSPTATSKAHSTSLPYQNETEGLLTYDAICVPHHQRSIGSTVANVSVKECVAGFPPNRDSCSGNGTCAMYSYHATHNPSYDVWTFNDTTSVATVKYEPGAIPTPLKKTTRLLCRTAGDKLGLCDGSTCVNATVQDDSSWYNRSRWVDNCEEPNPCWYGENIEIFGTGIRTSRTSCLSNHADALCRVSGLQFTYKAAVVWLQHLRCDAGAYSTTSTFCRGLPFRLWVCAMCNATETSYEYYDRICDKRKRNITSPCSFLCQENGTTKSVSEYITEGAECLDSTADKRKYCYGGTCFDAVKLNEQTRPETQPHAECEKKKMLSEG